MKSKPNSTHIIWLIYLALLGVLLPHTAWAFARFEPLGKGGVILAWLLAFAFEAALAIFTHKLAKHIEHQPHIRDPRRRFIARYVNAYAGGLFIAWLVSSLANLAHAVEFGRPLKILDAWGIPFAVYAIAFGAILPLTSLLFARVLSNTVETEQGIDPEIAKLKELLREANTRLRETEQQRTATEHQLTATEQRYLAVEHLIVRLFGDDKPARILAAKEQWPALPARSVAIIADCAPSYVSEVLNGQEVDK